MTEQRIAAGRAVVAAVVADELGRVRSAVRDTVESDMEPGEKLKATLPDGTHIGTVQRTEPARSVKVNLSVLMEWVQEHRPDMVVSRIDDVYLSLLLDQCKKYGHAFDKATGEVIPGVTLSEEGRASFRVTPSAEGRALILSRLTSLAAQGLLALPSADTEDTT